MWRVRLIFIFKHSDESHTSHEETDTVVEVDCGFKVNSHVRLDGQYNITVVFGVWFVEPHENSWHGEGGPRSYTVFVFLL
jgi:hypothetical protein